MNLNEEHIRQTTLEATFDTFVREIRFLETALKQEELYRPSQNRSELRNEETPSQG